MYAQIDHESSAKVSSDSCTQKMTLYTLSLAFIEESTVHY